MRNSYVKALVKAKVKAVTLGAASTALLFMGFALNLAALPTCIVGIVKQKKCYDMEKDIANEYVLQLDENSPEYEYVNSLTKDEIVDLAKEEGKFQEQIKKAESKGKEGDKLYAIAGVSFLVSCALLPCSDLLKSKAEDYDKLYDEAERELEDFEL